MRDFDAERDEELANRDLDFTVCGVTFHVRPFVAPEVMAAFDTSGDGMIDVLKGYDDFVVAVILPEEGDAWRKVRADADPPLNLATIEKISQYLLSAAAGRPTIAPSPSGGGRSRRQATLAVA